MPVRHDLDFSHVTACTVIAFHGFQYAFLEEPVTLLGRTRDFESVYANVNRF
jgi:hypothetical protein